MARARAIDPATRNRPTLYIDWTLRVALDAKSKEGLLRTARSRGITHQEAARYLIANTRP